MQSQSYTVPSATTPGRSYRVTVHADGVLSCDCPDATYRRRQCKHQRQVIVMWTATGRAALAAAPQTPGTPVRSPFGQAVSPAEIAVQNAAATDRTEVAKILGGW